MLVLLKFIGIKRLCLTMAATRIKIGGEGGGGWGACPFDVVCGPS